MRTFVLRPLTAAFFGCVLAGSAACGGGQNAAKSPHTEGGEGQGGPAEVGKPAPDLSIQTVNGKGRVSLESLSGKIAIVDFWATWCGPCKQSFPKLEELSRQNEGKVLVVGISVDDKQEGVANFAKENGATFAIAWDDGHAIANRWHVESMPTTYVLDATGTVRYVHAGYRGGEAEEITKEVAALTTEPSSKGKTEVASSTPDSRKPDSSKVDTARADSAKSETSTETPASAAPKDENTAEKAMEPVAAPRPKKHGKGRHGSGTGGGTGGGGKKGGKKPKKK